MSPSNLPTSVHQRLRNWALQNDQDMNLVLTRYALERLLFRLSQSAYAQRFVLKGAMLFMLWSTRSHRPTRDLDLLAYGDPSDKGLAYAFGEICRIDAPADGLRFDAENLRVSVIREDQEYEGRRVEMTAYLGKSRIKVQVDVGFGDAITPEPAEAEYPTLLDLPAPRIRVYPRETVVTEKLQAMVMLGMVNSRMKDFYDLLIMSREFMFAGDALVAAITATFDRRRTALPSEVPRVLSAEFGRNDDKLTQWNAFLRRSRLDAPAGDFAEVVEEIARFLLPPLHAASTGRPFTLVWAPGGPWR